MTPRALFGTAAQIEHLDGNVTLETYQRGQTITYALFAGDEFIAAGQHKGHLLRAQALRRTGQSTEQAMRATHLQRAR